MRFLLKARIIRGLKGLLHPLRCRLFQQRDWGIAGGGRRVLRARL